MIHRKASVSDQQGGRAHLLFRVLRADSGQTVFGALILIRQADRRRGGTVDSSGVAIVDALMAGPAELMVRAIGFRAFHGTLDVRSGYGDTLDIALALWCD